VRVSASSSRSANRISISHLSGAVTAVVRPPFARTDAAHSSASPSASRPLCCAASQLRAARCRAQVIPNRKDGEGSHTCSIGHAQPQIDTVRSSVRSLGALRQPRDDGRAGAPMARMWPLADRDQELISDRITEFQNERGGGCCPSSILFILLILSVLCKERRSGAQRSRVIPLRRRSS
jgi:hypothetical protein